MDSGEARRRVGGVVGGSEEKSEEMDSLYFFALPTERCLIFVVINSFGVRCTESVREAGWRRAHNAGVGTLESLSLLCSKTLFCTLRPTPLPDYP